MQRVLITGIGRSGTGYMSKLLSEAGLPCGHEKVFHQRTSRLPDWRGLSAESSWLAVPWLGSLPEDVSVVHLVRHPVKWLASWALSVWEHRGRTRPQGRSTSYIERQTGVAWVSLASEDVMDASMRLWVLWNEKVVRADRRMKIELVGREELSWILSSVGAPLDRVQGALDDTPHNVNSRPHGAVRWADVRSRPSAKPFAELAGRYGYDVEEFG